MTEFTESEIRAALHRAVRDEPPLTLDRDRVLADGRRRVRRRAAAYSLAAFTAVAVVSAGTLAAGALSSSGSSPMPPAAPSVAPRPMVLITPPGGVHAPGPPPRQSPAVVAEINSNALVRTYVDWGENVQATAFWPATPFRFEVDGSMIMRLSTPTGSRRLLVQVQGPSKAAPQVECPPRGVSAAVCFQERRPDGTVLVVNENDESITATSRRPDNTYVTVQETADPDSPPRRSRVLGTSTIVALALIPGFRADP